MADRDGNGWRKSVALQPLSLSMLMRAAAEYETTNIPSPYKRNGPQTHFQDGAHSNVAPAPSQGVLPARRQRQMPFRRIAGAYNHNLADRAI